LEGVQERAVIDLVRVARQVEIDGYDGIGW
jgi:hypothetical protein